MIQRCVIVVLVLRPAYCCVLRTAYLLLSSCVLALVSCCVLRTCSRGMHLRGRFCKHRDTCRPGRFAPPRPLPPNHRVGVAGRLTRLRAVSPLGCARLRLPAQFNTRAYNGAPKMLRDYWFYSPVQVGPKRTRNAPLLQAAAVTVAVAVAVL